MAFNSHLMTESNLEQEWIDWIGKSVCIKGVKRGTLQYFGPTQFAEGLWCGVELDDPIGKNDGAIGGVRYFLCKPMHGIFAPVSKVEKVVDENKELNIVSLDTRFRPKKSHLPLPTKLSPQNDVPKIYDEHLQHDCDQVDFAFKSIIQNNTSRPCRSHSLNFPSKIPHKNYSQKRRYENIDSNEEQNTFVTNRSYKNFKGNITAPIASETLYSTRFNVESLPLIEDESLLAEGYLKESYLHSSLSPKLQCAKLNLSQYENNLKIFEKLVNDLSIDLLEANDGGALIDSSIEEETFFKSKSCDNFDFLESKSSIHFENVDSDMHCQNKIDTHVKENSSKPYDKDTLIQPFNLKFSPFICKDKELDPDLLFPLPKNLFFENLEHLDQEFRSATEELENTSKKDYTINSKESIYDWGINKFYCNNQTIFRFYSLPLLPSESKLSYGTYICERKLYKTFSSPNITGNIKDDHTYQSKMNCNKNEASSKIYESIKVTKCSKYKEENLFQEDALRPEGTIMKDSISECSFTKEDIVCNKDRPASTYTVSSTDTGYQDETTGSTPVTDGPMVGSSLMEDLARKLASGSFPTGGMNDSGGFSMLDGEMDASGELRFSKLDEILSNRPDQLDVEIPDPEQRESQEQTMGSTSPQSTISTTLTVEDLKEIAKPPETMDQKTSLSKITNAKKFSLSNEGMKPTIEPKKKTNDQNLKFGGSKQNSPLAQKNVHKMFKETSKPPVSHNKPSPSNERGGERSKEAERRLPGKAPRRPSNTGTRSTVSPAATTEEKARPRKEVRGRLTTTTGRQIDPKQGQAPVKTPHSPRSKPIVKDEEGKENKPLNKHSIQKKEVVRLHHEDPTKMARLKPPLSTLGKPSKVKVPPADAKSPPKPQVTPGSQRSPTHQRTSIVSATSLSGSKAKPLPSTKLPSSGKPPLQTKPRGTGQKTGITITDYKRPPLWMSKADLSREIHNLEAQCEARTKQLRMVKMQLNQATLGFDAFAVLIKYLTDDLDAFSNPRLVRDIQEAQQKLIASHLQIAYHQKELEELKKKNEGELINVHQMLDMAHTNEIASLQERYTAQVKSLETRHQSEIEALQEKHENILKESQNRHLNIINVLKEEHLNSIQNLELAHQSELEEASKNYQKIQQELQEQLDEVQQQYTALQNQVKKAEMALQKGIDSKIQWISAKRTDLEQEVESLQAVLELKHSEISKLRSENNEMKKELEDLPILKEKIKKLKAREEDLVALIDEKTKLQKKLISENQQVLQSFKKESQLSKRLTMENEELQWKLRCIESSLMTSPTYSGSNGSLRKASFCRDDNRLDIFVADDSDKSPFSPSTTESGLCHVSWTIPADNDTEGSLVAKARYKRKSNSFSGVGTSQRLYQARYKYQRNRSKTNEESQSPTSPKLHSIQDEEDNENVSFDEELKMDDSFSKAITSSPLHSIAEVRAVPCPVLMSPQSDQLQDTSSSEDSYSNCSSSGSSSRQGLPKVAEGSGVPRGCYCPAVNTSPRSLAGEAMVQQDETSLSLSHLIISEESSLRPQPCKHQRVEQLCQEEATSSFDTSSHPNMTNSTDTDISWDDDKLMPSEVDF